FRVRPFSIDCRIVGAVYDRGCQKQIQSKSERPTAGQDFNDCHDSGGGCSKTRSTLQTSARRFLLIGTVRLSTERLSLATRGHPRLTKAGNGFYNLLFMKRPSGQVGEFSELTGAVAELLSRNAHLIEQRQLKVRQRRVLRVN